MCVTKAGAGCCYSCPGDEAAGWHEGAASTHPCPTRSLPPHAGTSWATAFACVQAAVAAVAQGKPGTAAVALAAPLLFAACLLRTTATAQGSHLLLAPLQPVAAAYRQEARPWRLLLPRLSLRWALAAARSRRATRRLASQGLPSTACAP